MFDYILFTCIALMIISLGFISYLYIKSRMFRKKCETAFNNIYEQSSLHPSYEMEYQYGFPHFTVTFKSNMELDTANKNGFNERFSNAIEELCKGIGSKENPFDVERAIFFTSEEYLENLHKKYS